MRQVSNRRLWAAFGAALLVLAFVATVRAWRAGLEVVSEARDTLETKENGVSLPSAEYKFCAIYKKELGRDLSRFARVDGWRWNGYVLEAVGGPGAVLESSDLGDVGALEQVRIDVAGQDLDLKMRVEYSIDGGKRWETVRDGITHERFSFWLPDGASKIRVRLTATRTPKGGFIMYRGIERFVVELNPHLSEEKRD